jgi:hypothetical protein
MFLKSIERMGGMQGVSFVARRGAAKAGAIDNSPCLY